MKNMFEFVIFIAVIRVNPCKSVLFIINLFMNIILLWIWQYKSVQFLFILDSLQWGMFRTTKDFYLIIHCA